jgi:hypothetical protein
LEKFSEGVKVIADKNDGLFVDQFHPYLAALDRARGQAHSGVIRLTFGNSAAAFSQPPPNLPSGRAVPVRRVSTAISTACQASRNHD